MSGEDEPRRVGMTGCCEWTPAEPAATCAGYRGCTLGGPGDRWTTGAREDHSARSVAYVLAVSMHPQHGQWRRCCCTPRLTYGPTFPFGDVHVGGIQGWGFPQLPWPDQLPRLN